MTTQHELLHMPDAMICGPCLQACIPEEGEWPTWRCPKCGAIYPRKREASK